MNKAAATRLMILEKAFELIYTKGYQTTSIDDIIATTKVTKGAFYYHFKNKDEMGLAVINDILKPTMLHDFIEPLQKAKDPIKMIYTMMENLLLKNELLKVEYGCPAGNLTQEMTPWNTAFGNTLSAMIDQWRQAIIESINTAKKNGIVRKNVNGAQVALWIMSGYWGIRNFGKLYNSKDCYYPFLKELKNYLNSLK